MSFGRGLASMCSGLYLRVSAGRLGAQGTGPPFICCSSCMSHVRPGSCPDACLIPRKLCDFCHPVNVWGSTVLGECVYFLK